MKMNTANSCFTDSMLSAIQPRTDDCSSKGNGEGGGLGFCIPIHTFNFDQPPFRQWPGAEGRGGGGWMMANLEQKVI